ncbi:MAG: HIRAN domain-containing protein [Paludibacteraceae bacterium]|nr:HIRAN domain-containing protein [Paludibacteraceae bacterium]
METRKKFFMECHLAGRMYHEADEVWEKLKVGTELRMERDLENRYDRDAVAVMYDDKKAKEAYCIGYIPQEKNKTIASLLEMGWTNLFECRINRINADTHPENQIHLTIKIKKNK